MPSFSKPPPKVPTASPLKPAAGPVRTAKTFSIQPLQGNQEGDKIVIYAPSGLGKTTLAASAPDPVFIMADDGARKLLHPKTGAALRGFPVPDTFEDVRDIAQQIPNLLKKGQTAVFDTGTAIELLAEKYVIRTVKVGGSYAENLEDFGYGKGYKHLLDAMRLFVCDLDPIIRKGINVVLLCQESQATIANLDGLDYLKDGPKLAHNKQFSIRAEVLAWADHVFRIGYPDLSVARQNLMDNKATKGRVAGSTDRAVYTVGALNFEAKNRMNGKLPPIVSFSEPADDSLWQYMFGEADYRKESKE